MCTLATYPLYCFTQFVTNLDRRLEAGWFLVACILLNILFNVILLVYQAAFQTKQKIKFYFLRKIAKRNYEQM